MRFHYPSFRAEYSRRLRERQADEDRSSQHDAVARPTEFMALLRVEAARQRLELTDLEKRVLHFDKEYLRTVEQAQSEVAYVSLARARYIARRAGCPQREVPSLLASIDRIFARNIALERMPDVALPAHLCEQRRSYRRRRERGRSRARHTPHARS